MPQEWALTTSRKLSISPRKNTMPALSLAGRGVHRSTPISYSPVMAWKRVASSSNTGCSRSQSP